MKKYVYAAICVTYSFLRFCIIKLFHVRNFSFNAVNIVSPFVEIELEKNSSLKLGKLLKARSRTEIRVREGAAVEIGDHTFLNHGCMIVSHQKIKIGNGVQFGPNVLLYDHDHDFRIQGGLKDLKYTTAPIKIGDNVWIGANTIILKGSQIGDSCVVGAGCVIKGEFPDNAIIIQKRKTEIVERKAD
jgi:acetyltransferase-like isoleucine patch superfamily enzyme